MPISGKKIGDAAWEDCVALCPVTVLTTVTENREQEVMLSSPVSLAPLSLEQSRCHTKRGLIPGMMFNISANLYAFELRFPIRRIDFACKKYIIWMKYLPRDFNAIAVTDIKVRDGFHLSLPY